MRAYQAGGFEDPEPQQAKHGIAGSDAGTHGPNAMTMTCVGTGPARSSRGSRSHHPPSLHDDLGWVRRNPGGSYRVRGLGGAMVPVGSISCLP
jgi:hypothetical protein